MRFINNGKGGSGGIDTSDATATPDDIIAPETAYVKGEKITGNIKIETEKTTNYEVLTVNTSGISDISSDKKFRIYVDGKNLCITRINNSSILFSETCTLGKVSWTSIRFSPIIDINVTDNKNIYTVFAGCVQHDGDSDFCRIIEFKADNDTFEILNNVQSKNMAIGFEGSGCVIFPSMNRRNVCCMVSANRQNKSQIHAIQLINNNIINYSYRTKITASEQITVSGDWNDDTFYCNSSDNILYSVVLNFFNDELVNITGTVIGNFANRSYASTYYMEGDTLYNINGIIQKQYPEITGQVKISVFDNNDFMNVLLLQNQALTIYKINLQTLDLSLVASYKTDIITWNCTSSSPVIADKVRIKLYASSEGRLCMMSTSMQSNIISMTRNNIKYITTTKANVLPQHVIAGIRAIGLNGLFVGAMPNNEAIEIIPSDAEQLIPLGYHNGEGKVLPIDYNNTLTPEDYLQCITISDEILSENVNRYKELNDIQFGSSQQYINTNIKYDINYKIGLDINIQDSDVDRIIISGASSNSSGNFIAVINRGFPVWSKYDDIQTSSVHNTRHLLEFYRGQVWIDGSLIGGTSEIKQTAIDNADVITLLGDKNGSARLIKGVIYSFYIQNMVTQEYICNCVPALDIVMNKTGLLDSEKKFFFASASNVDFISGGIKQ